MYAHDPDAQVLLQGDIVRQFIVVEPVSEFFVLRGTSEEDLSQYQACSIDACDDAFANDRDIVVSEATRTDVAIVSQSCDVQRKPFVTVAAVQPVEGIWSPTKVGEARTHDKHLRYFVLDPRGSFPLSVIDFSLLYTVRRQTLIAHIGKRELSMTEETRAAFQHKLAWYFARPAE